MSDVSTQHDQEDNCAIYQETRSKEKEWEQMRREGHDHCALGADSWWRKVGCPGSDLGRPRANEPQDESFSFAQSPWNMPCIRRKILVC